MASQNFSKLPRWDLSNVFPALESEQFKKAAAGLTAQIDALDVYLVERKISKTMADKSKVTAKEAKSVIDEYLTLTNVAFRLFATLNAYVASYVSTDSYNTVAKRLESELEMVGVRLEKQEVLFKGWIGAVRDVLPAVLAQEAQLRLIHSIFMRRRNRAVS